MTTAGDYRVDLDLYSGPLDLLLYLVRREEVDVRDVPLGRIVDQFAEFVAVLEFLDLDAIGEFLVTASTLVEIKSRLVLPPERTEEDEPPVEEDPRSELFAKLIEYRRFKEAAQALDERAALWQERYPRLHDDRPTKGKDPSADRIKEVELWDLVSALSRILRTKEVQREGRIRLDEVPLHVHVERVAERVRREQRVAFSSFFEGTNQRSRIVGVFLAILELLRHHGFRAEQPLLHGEIWVLPPTDENAAAAQTGD